MAVGGIAQAAMAPAGPSGANGNNQTTSYDGSGWSVNVGSGSASATGSTSTPALAANVNSLLKNPVVLVGLAVAAYFFLRR